MAVADASRDRTDILRATGVVGSATMISRVLGLVRDGVLAFLFGATGPADAFFVAFRIPNLMRQLFGEGALASTFVPVYTDIREKQGELGARGFANGMFTVLVLVLTLVSAGGVLFAPGIVRLVAWGFEPGSDIFRLTVLLTRWMFPYVVLICAAAAAMGMLNARGHFFAPAIAPALLNISMITFALAFSGVVERPVLAVAWGVLVGGLLQLAVQIPPMAARGVLPRPVKPAMTPDIRRMLLLMGPAVLGVAVYQVNMLVDTLIASFLPQGSISYLWYGNRLMQFPLGVFGIALATAALPTLSQQVSEGRDADFSRTLSFALSLTAFIGFPAAAGLVALREPIMTTLFARGAFGGQDVAGAATALLFYAVGLPFIIGVKILGRAFYAMENTRIPFAAATAALVSNAILNVILMGPLGHGGLALATSLAALINFFVLALYLLRMKGKSWLGDGLKTEVIRAGLAAAVMLAVILPLASRVHWLGGSLPVRAGWLLGCVVCGIVVYSLAALALGSKSMKTLKNRLAGQ